jgi:hypothetical protein
VWTSRVDAPAQPDVLVFDLDPPDNGFEMVRVTARLVEKTLGGLALPAFVKTTGSKGLHVIAPLDGRDTYATVEQLAAAIAAKLCAAYPELLTTEFYKKDRKGRLFLDTMRNAPGATFVAAYSLRGKPHLPVSAPITWAEVDDDALRPDLAAVQPPAGPCPKALIVPHAGYIYSGPIAASAFARIAPYGDRIERVVLVGPAHRVFVSGLATTGADRLRTPLGDVEVEPIDVAANPAAHAREHSLEVELPFLQKVCPRARVIAMCGSRAKPEDVGAVLDRLWGGPETLIVISSDLSHYLPYAEGRALDERTAQQILALDPTIEGEHACGSIGINGLLWLARRNGLTAELVDLRSSGDTVGPRDEVVGYGAFAFYEAA